MCNHSQGFYHGERDEGLDVSHRTGVDSDAGMLPAYPAPASEEPEQETWSMERR